MGILEAIFFNGWMAYYVPWDARAFGQVIHDSTKRLFEQALGPPHDVPCTTAHTWRCQFGYLDLDLELPEKTPYKAFHFRTSFYKHGSLVAGLSIYMDKDELKFFRGDNVRDKVRWESIDSILNSTLTTIIKGFT